uniref:RES domain-containing protein n=1 Tax=Bursaphelenchus xylophilus TaxID=6326 RepID=A0A1I7SEX8_BURXY
MAGLPHPNGIAWTEDHRAVVSRVVYTPEESLIEDRSDYRSAINGQGAPLSQSLGKQLAGRPMLAAVGGPGDTVRSTDQP